MPRSTEAVLTVIHIRLDDMTLNQYQENFHSPGVHEDWLVYGLLQDDKLVWSHFSD